MEALKIKGPFLKRIHNGLLVAVEPREHIQQQLFWYGFYEKIYVLTWEAFILPGAVVLDIGANFGYYSMVAAPKASAVYAFEPEPGNFTNLCAGNVGLASQPALIAVESHQC